MDVVTQVLIDRSRTAEHISRAVVLSLVAHGMLLAGIALAPKIWGTHEDANAPVMTISLGGAPGPVQGRNPISGKPIQEAVKDLPKTKVDIPPAAAKPEMVEPLKTARPVAKAPAKTAPEKSLHTPKPTTGLETRTGSSRVETHGAEIPFGGLATGGGGGGGAYTDVKNFCCPEYLQTITEIIRRNWDQRQQQTGSVTVKFTIQRNGTITDVQVEQGATQFLNLASQRAIVATRQLPPLPPAFTGSYLTIHLAFDYR